MLQSKTLVSAFSAIVSVLLVILAKPAAASSFTIAYCSSQNTGSSNPDLEHTWQSNGWCHDQCNGKYAFAIVKDLDCWCSNYIPSDQQDTGQCNEPCPGFPDEKCGNKDKNLYGYIALDMQPSGTQGTSKPTSSMKPSAPPSSSAPVSTPDPQTVVETVSGPVVTVTPTPSSAPSSTPSSAPSSTPAPSAPSSSAAPTTMKTTPSSTATSTTWTPTPITQVQTLTVSGTVVTKTVTSMSTAPPALSQSEKKGSNAGVIAGAVIGAVAGIALIAVLIFFLLRRHRKNQEQDGADQNQSGVQRNVSTMSKQGLLSSNRPYLPPVATSMSRSSRHMDSESISPLSMSDRRNSRPMVYDQRLNPSAIMDMDNASRSSLVTMEDNRDYTRTLNIRNPDPDHH